MTNLSTSAGQVGRSLPSDASSWTFPPTKRKTRPVEIKRIIRPMRGGSQARLIEGQDGRFYVAKFANNPQTNRTLVNEWITQSIMTALSISTPPLCLLRLPESLRDETLCFEIGNEKVPVDGEWHLGSLCPVNPETKAIFDFLPRKFLKNISNLNDFAKTFVVDRWLYQLDQRQAIFVRERSSEVGQIQFRAHFIDHGMSFGGASWELHEATGHGLYMDREVYSLINMSAVCDEAVSQIEKLTETEVFSSLATLPDSWISSDEKNKLNRLLGKLYENRGRLPRMIAGQLASAVVTRNVNCVIGKCYVEDPRRKGMALAGRSTMSSAMCS